MEELAASIASAVQNDVTFHTVKKKKVDNEKASAAASATGAVPKRKAVTNPSQGPSKSAKQQLLSNNQYALLPPDDGDEEPTAKKERVPPIITTVKDVEKLKAAFTKYQLQPRFQLCSVGTKIICSSLQEYGAIGELFLRFAIPFYTHDIPSSKPLKVVLRGLPALDPAVIKVELETLGLKPLAVYPMTRRTAENNSTSFRDQLYLIHLVKGSTSIGALKNIKDLFRLIVRWEPYRPQHRDVTQCTKCLAFGHGTKNCHMKPRCGKCAGSHLTASCGDDDTAELRCANCGQNHHATNRTCPKRAEFIGIRKKASTEKQPGRQRKQPPPPAVNQTTYPQLLPSLIQLLTPLPLPNNNNKNDGAKATPTTNDNNKNQGKPKFSAQPRLAAAAGSTTTPAPGLSYAGVTAGSFSGASSSAPNSNDDSPLTTEELVQIITAAIQIKRQYTTRSQQLAAIVALIGNGP